jgi:RNA polymerase sigma factor (sigma-70 family)
VLDSTEKLTAWMAAGDEGAVEEFYRRYFGWLYAQARRASRRDEAFCLDVVQDAVLRIVRTVRRVKSESQFCAWLRLVVQTTAYDRLRMERRLRGREAAVSREERLGEEPVFGVEEKNWLREQIELLDPGLARLVELRFEKQWSLKRIAAAMGLSIGTIDGRLRRMIGRLRVDASEKFDV